jgi:uncharacterized protein YrrD
MVLADAPGRRRSHRRDGCLVAFAAPPWTRVDCLVLRADRGGRKSRPDARHHGAARNEAAMTPVLLRSSDLIGRPVVDMHGNDVAEIRDIIFDAASGTITGFTLRERGFLGRRFKDVLALADIGSVGTDAVMIADPSVLLAPNDAPADMAPAKSGDVLNDRVITESGRELGMVKDVIVLGGASPRVVAFEVADGSAGPGLIPLAAPSAMSGSALIVPDDYEMRIRSDLTGLAAELSLIEESLG